MSILMRTQAAGLADARPTESFDSSESEQILAVVNSPSRYLHNALQKRQMANAPAAEFDNFHTPDNAFFYSRSPYMKLDSERKEIRLLRVVSSKTYEQHIYDRPEWKLDESTSGQLFNDHQKFGLTDVSDIIIACELVDKVSLSSVNGAYTVLSYCAGSPKNVKPLLVDGLPFRAFANLEHAIRNIYDHWKKSTPENELLLWADQACINQRDHAERASQVAMMQDIYRRGNETIVCLSSPGSLDCLKWIPDVCLKAKTASTVDSFRDFVRDEILRDKAPTNKRAYLGYRRAIKSSDRKKWSYMDSKQWPYGDNNQWLRGFENLLKRPWWTRAWVYQEFIMSTQVRLFSYESCIPWSKLSPILNYIFNDIEKDLTEILKTTERDDSKYQQLMELWDSQRQVEWAQEKKDKETKYAAYYIAKIEDIKTERATLAAEIRNLSRLHVFDHARLQTEHKRLSKSLRMWQESIPSKASDLNLEPSSPNSHNAHVLATLRNSFYVPSNLDQYQSQQPQPAKPKSVSLTKTRVSELRLGLQTLPTSNIRSMISKKGSGKCLDLKVHLDHSRNCDSSDPRDRIYAFVGLSHKEYGIMPNYRPENTIIHVLIQTAKSIIVFERSLDILSHVGHGRDRLGCFLPSWVPDWTSKFVNKGTSKAESSLGYKRVGLMKDRSRSFCASAGSELIIEFIEDTLNSSNVQIEITGVFIEAIRTAGEFVEEWDGVRQIPGAKGSKIIGPGSAIEGDEVWVLCGASKPVLLRPEGNNGYGFLGDVLLLSDDGEFSEIMFGATVKEVEKGELNEVKIRIM